MEIVEFLKNNWLIALIVLIVVVLLVRAMFKLAIVAVIIGVVLVVVFDYTPNDVLFLGKNALHEMTTLYEKSAKPVLENELENAEYALYPDGRFTVKTENVEISGTKNGETVIVRYKEKEMEVKVSKLGNAVKKQIEMMQTQMPAE